MGSAPHHSSANGRTRHNQLCRLRARGNRTRLVGPEIRPRNDSRLRYTESVVLTAPRELQSILSPYKRAHLRPHRSAEHRTQRKVIAEGNKHRASFVRRIEPSVNSIPTMALAGDIRSVLPLPEEPDVAYNVRSMIGRINPIGSGISSWMGREATGERTLAGFDGMNKSTWQPATNAVGVKVHLATDAAETTMFRKGEIGWWTGEQQTKKVPRHSVRAQTAVYFPTEKACTFEKKPAPDIENWKIAFPLAVETFIKRKSPTARVNFAVDQVSEVAIEPRVSMSRAKAQLVCLEEVLDQLVGSHSHLVPGTKIYCRAYHLDGAPHTITTCLWADINTTFFVHGKYDTQYEDAAGNTKQLSKASPLIFLGSLIDTYNQGDPHLRLSLAPMAI